MKKLTMILLTAVFGFTASAQAVCTAYVEPYLPAVERAERAALKKETYETLVKIAKKKGWTLSRHQNIADITVSGSCHPDGVNMLSNITVTDNLTRETLDIQDSDMGFFIEGECMPALQNAGQSFPVCEK